MGIALLSAWLVSAFWLSTPAQAVDYTSKQLDAFAARVGKTYWVSAVNNRTPTFLTSPAPNAGSFQAPANEAFDIVELVGRAAGSLFYKVKFESGRDGYIRPDAFHEEFNLTIVSQDPQAETKQKAQKAGEEDKQRLDWIKTQPWSAAVKEGAMKRRVAAGMNTAEVEKILGAPTRKVKFRSAAATGEEHWYYPEGPILIFNNGLLSRMEERPQSQK